MLDILVKNAIVYDGTLNPGQSHDIGIGGEMIQALGDLSGQEAHEVLDAKGCIVAPGFIDVHSHSDFSCLALPTSDSKVFGGVTTEVIGNCGLSSAPLLGECKAHLQDSYKELGIPLDWSDLEGYARRVGSQGISVNILPMIGHGNIRASVIGYSDRNPTAGELARMKDLLREMMQQGACGLSTGLIYPPGIFSTTQELIELGKVLEEFQGVYASHMRSEGDRLLESIEEVLAIGRACQIPVQISHLKTAGQRNWHKLADAFSLISGAIAEGMDVSVDRYPYAASSTDLDSIFPAWAFDGGNESEIRRLKDPAILAQIKTQVQESHPDPKYWENIMIACVQTPANKPHEGKTIAQLARDTRQEPFEAIVKLLLEENLKVQAIFFSMSQDNLRQILQQPYAMIGSDSSSRAVRGKMSGGKPHPRSYGTFARVLQQFVRQENTLPLAEAIYKMTLLPARKFGIARRGMIEVGMFADLVVFDPSRIEDVATYQDPHRYPAGISWVLVNGQIVVRQGEHTHALPGKVLLRSN